jgi:SNF2 family DNA or RNA helicase
MAKTFVPHPYQAYCISRLLDTPRIALWLEPGLGKTAVTLSAIAELKYNYLAVRKVLVVAPKKVAEKVWSSEAAKWAHLHRLRVQTVLGGLLQRVRALLTPADVYVINRENVEWLVDYYREAWPFDVVVLDEASSFKHHQTKRFRALRSVLPRITRLIELTGTPSSNGLMDLWAQIYLLDGGARLGRTIGAYRERFFSPDKRNAMQIWSWRAKEGAEDAVSALLGDICVSMRAQDYLQLPPLVIDTIPVMLDPRAMSAYRELERKMVLELPDGVLDVGSAGALSNKLLQLCNGAVYADEAVLHVHDCKLDAFDELIEQLGGQHVLVFYAYRHDLDRLRDRLGRRKGLRVRVCNTAADQDAWCAGEVDVLLAHPASCAYGLNLQEGGHHVIWFGLTWNLEHVIQATERLHRQGQLYPVVAHFLVVQGTRDEDVIAAQDAKRGSQDALMQSLMVRVDAIRRAA